MLPADTYALPIDREFIAARVPEAFLSAVLAALGLFLTVARSRRWRSVPFLYGVPTAFADAATLLFAAQSLWSYWSVR